MAKVVNVKEDDRERVFLSLNAIGFSKQDGEQSLAIVNAGEAVVLSARDRGFAKDGEFLREPVRAQNHVESNTPILRFARTQDDVADDALMQAVRPLARDRGRDENDWKALAGRFSEYGCE